MTTHPAKDANCNPFQVRTFESLCQGDKAHNSRTLRVLTRKHLILMEYERIPPSRNCSVPINVERPYVPDHIRLQYFKWRKEHGA